MPLLPSIAASLLALGSLSAPGASPEPLPAHGATAPALRCEGKSSPAAVAPWSAVARADSALTALYASGESFEAFLANARSRKAMWEKNWTDAKVPDDVLAQARAIAGKWRLLVVAVDGCSDSVNTIPYLARLVSLVPSLELRVVLPGPGRPVQEAHRTPDGRAATPTVVILDEAGNDAGCWVERPKELQDGAIKARAEGKMEEWAAGKQAWYDQDAGHSTMREVVAVIAAAASGARVCGSADNAPARTP